MSQIGYRDDVVGGYHPKTFNILLNITSYKFRNACRCLINNFLSINILSFFPIWRPPWIVYVYTFSSRFILPPTKCCYCQVPRADGAGGEGRQDRDRRHTLAAVRARQGKDLNLLLATETIFFLNYYLLITTYCMILLFPKLQFFVIFPSSSYNFLLNFLAFYLIFKPSCRTLLSPTQWARTSSTGASRSSTRSRRPRSRPADPNPRPHWPSWAQTLA